MEHYLIVEFDSNDIYIKKTNTDDLSVVESEMKKNFGDNKYFIITKNTDKTNIYQLIIQNRNKRYIRRYFEQILYYFESNYNHIYKELIKNNVFDEEEINFYQTESKNILAKINKLNPKKKNKH